MIHSCLSGFKFRSKMQNSDPVEKTLKTAAILIKMSQENPNVIYALSPNTQSVKVELKLETPTLVKTVQKLAMAMKNKPVEADNQPELDLITKTLKDVNADTDKVTVKKAFTCDVCHETLDARTLLEQHLK